MGSALVLGGGGVTGIAWTTGLLLGLAEAGVDLTDADLVVGTSAGATVGAQLAVGRDLEELFALQLQETSAELAVEFDLDALVAIFTELVDGAADAAARARVGAMAIDARTVPEPVRREVIEARIATDVWPSRRLLVTAVDTSNGELVVFDGSDGTGLIDAVAASCAVPGVWPPVTIGDRRLIDGGVRSITNADLAAGSDPVVIVVPLTGMGQAALDRELALLRDDGAAVTVLSADLDATAAMGPNPLDPTMRRPAAEAGRRQGAAISGPLQDLWCRP